MSQDLPAADAGEGQPRRRLGCLFYAGCLVLVLVITLAISFRLWQSNAANELASEIKKIQARREPVWFADLAPSPVDPIENGTQLYLAAVAKLKPLGQGISDLLNADPPTPPGNYAEFEGALEANRPALELLAQAVRRPFFRLPIDYRTTQPISLIIEPIQHARDFSWLLRGDVLQSIGAGDNDRAVVAILDGLMLSEMLRDEPVIISQLVRIAVAGSMLRSLETAVAHIDLTPEQFAALDDQLALMESRFRLAPSVQGERSSLLTTMHNLGDNVDLLGDPADGGPTVRILNSGALRPLRMADEAFMLHIMSRFAEDIDRAGPEGADGIRQVEAELMAARAGLRHVLTCLLVPAVMQARDAGMRHRQHLINARFGMRVGRYFAEHGKFPDTLDAVTDAKLPAVAVDLYTSKPLVYRVRPDGFTIYSVGANGTDEGGGERPDMQEHASRFEVNFPRLSRANEKPNNTGGGPS